MRWRKLGLLYSPTPLHAKLLSHAANPMAVAQGGERYRIYFSARDERKRSSVGHVDLDLGSGRILAQSAEPDCEHGDPGSYCADGISIGNPYQTLLGRYVGFMGWQNPPDGHWRGDIGRLRIDDGRWRIADREPLLALDEIDPLSFSYPWIMRTGDGVYRMWYGSTLSWDAGNGEMLHVIQHASSDDGEHWRKRGLAVPYRIGSAQAFSRPTVVEAPDGVLHMWFSYRGAPGRSYRIGYARSTDRVNWTLALDEAGIDVSAHGWDAQMIEYPFVFIHDGRWLMLYNGDGYGASGFGLAELER